LYNTSEAIKMMMPFWKKLEELYVTPEEKEKYRKEVEEVCKGPMGAKLRNDLLKSDSFKSDSQGSFRGSGSLTISSPGKSDSFRGFPGKNDSSHSDSLNSSEEYPSSQSKSTNSGSTSSDDLGNNYW
jgi:hypothetical protein